MGDAKIPEGVPVSLGNLAWGCQILGGARFPMTPGRGGGGGVFSKHCDSFYATLCCTEEKLKATANVV